jgi:hypothetical protein
MIAPSVSSRNISLLKIENQLDLALNAASKQPEVTALSLKVIHSVCVYAISTDATKASWAMYAKKLLSLKVQVLARILSSSCSQALTCLPTSPQLLPVVPHCYSYKRVVVEMMTDAKKQANTE